MERGGADSFPYFHIWEPEHLGLRVEALWATHRMGPLLEKGGCLSECAHVIGTGSCPRRAIFQAFLWHYLALSGFSSPYLDFGFYNSSHVKVSNGLDFGLRLQLLFINLIDLLLFVKYRESLLDTFS